MGWFDGWPFKNKDQQEKERLEFERRVFPLGMAQRDAAQAVLSELVVGRKVKKPEALYAYITAKDCYEQRERTPEAMERARLAISANRWLSDAQIDLVLALVRLDSLIESLDDYPTAADVRAVCEGRYGAPD